MNDQQKAALDAVAMDRMANMKPAEPKPTLESLHARLTILENHPVLKRTATLGEPHVVEGAQPYHVNEEPSEVDPTHGVSTEVPLNPFSTGKLRDETALSVESNATETEVTNG